MFLPSRYLRLCLILVKGNSSSNDVPDFTVQLEGSIDRKFVKSSKNSSSVDKKAAFDNGNAS